MRFRIVAVLAFLFTTASRSPAQDPSLRIGGTNGPFPTRENLLKPLGPEAEAALKKLAEEAVPVKNKSLTEYIDSVVEKIDITVKLETGEADKLKLAAQELIDTASREWQSRLVASLRYQLVGDDSTQASRVRRWKPDSFVPQYTVQGWVPPDRRPAWEVAVKAVLGSDRTAQWTKVMEQARVDLDAKTREFLEDWAKSGREPMDETLREQADSMTQILELPPVKAKALGQLAANLVDDHVAAELNAGAELLGSIDDVQRPKNMKLVDAMAKRFVRPTDKELVKKWETIATKFLGDASIIAWKKHLAEKKAAELQAALPPNKIRWNNAESLPGNLVSSTADDVTWSAPFFTEPITVRWDVLRRIDMPVAGTAVTDAFSFALRDGSHICGDIEEITPQTISIKSKRHGEAILKRAEVLRARRLRGGTLVYNGPSGESEWGLPKDRSNSEQPTVLAGNIPIMTVDGGGMQIPYWTRAAFLDVKIPDLVDVVFRISSKQRPEFKLSLEAGAKRQLRIETWDDEIVLSIGNDFKSVMTLGEKDRELALRVCWDLTGKECSVFTIGGELLAAWEVPDGPARGGTGIMLVNKGRDLTLKHLRVREWDGKPPAPSVELSNPRIELADGSMLAGSVTSSAVDGVSIGAEKFPLSQIEEIIFSSDEPGTKQADMQVSWSDGTLVKGKIVAIKDNTLTMQTNFAAVPLTTRVDSLRQIFISTPLQPETPAAQLDKIQFTKNSLRGKLITANEVTPLWLPVGSDKPVVVAQEVQAKISRAFAKDADLPVVPALLYTRYGDILPGDMSSIDKSSLEIRSALIGKEQFAAEEVRAVQFGMEARLNLKNFQGPGWSIIKGGAKTVERDKGTLKIQPGGMFGHSSMMQASEINLTMDYVSFGALRLRFFSNGIDDSKSTNYVIANFGREIYSGIETIEGQLGKFDRTPFEHGKPVKVQFLIQEKQIEFKIDGMTVSRFNIDPAKKGHSGLYLEPTSLWGNQVNPISLSEFTATSPPGRTSLPNVSEETRTQALTIPRFRRDDPPCHLLIGSNGDVLRGEIEAATAKSYGFRFGMENITVPRDRVKAVVWLQNPRSDAQPTVKTPAQKALEMTLSPRFNFGSTTLASMTGMILREVPDLKLKIPSKQDNKRLPMNLSGQSVGRALNEIARQFGLRCRVSKDGTVILEPKTALAHDLLTKSFWLATEAFIPADGVKEILAAKGVFFPRGATVSYDADAMMLHSVNTRKNHGKIEQILQSDFGGVSGSPSHWLQLASGGRLALDVEKFGTEHIIGSTPRLGKCKVPIADVFAIHNTAPEADIVLAAVSNWHMVNAPEPVLPESGGGNSSALLGKDAADFKLPLLSGGDFELNKHRAKVVVLDFWATWCGPCVKSLPGLIAEMAKFPTDQVSFIGINQAENDDMVKRFLDTRSWNMTVAMDATQKVARQFGVDGIPHTVIIGRDGKVAWVHSGYTPGAAKDAAAAVAKALAAP